MLSQANGNGTVPDPNVSTSVVRHQNDDIPQDDSASAAAPEPLLPSRLNRKKVSASFSAADFDGKEPHHRNHRQMSVQATVTNHRQNRLREVQSTLVPRAKSILVTSDQRPLVKLRNPRRASDAATPADDEADQSLSGVAKKQSVDKLENGNTFKNNKTNGNFWIVGNSDVPNSGETKLTRKASRSSSPRPMMTESNPVTPANQVSLLQVQPRHSVSWTDDPDIEKSLIPFTHMVHQTPSHQPSAETLPPLRDEGNISPSHRLLAVRQHSVRSKSLGLVELGGGGGEVMPHTPLRQAQTEKMPAAAVAFTSPQGHRHLILPVKSGRCYSLQSYDPESLHDAAAVVVNMDHGSSDGGLASADEAAFLPPILSAEQILKNGKREGPIYEMQQTRRFRIAAIVMAVMSQMVTCLICFSVPAFLLAYRQPQTPTDRRHYQISLLFSALSMALSALVICVFIYVYVNTVTHGQKQLESSHGHYSPQSPISS